MSLSNLPPGVTPADIDRAAGAYDVECPGCSRTFEAIDLSEDGYCDDCEEERSKRECVCCGDLTHGELNCEYPMCGQCFDGGGWVTGNVEPASWNDIVVFNIKP